MQWRLKVLYIIGIALLILSACTAPPYSQSASPSWQHLPQRVINGTTFRHYTTVSRSDGSARHMIIDEFILQHWQPGQPLPHGALIVMQTWPTPSVESASFTKHVEADGAFSYGSFVPAQPNFVTHADNNCASCHEVSADKHGTFTQLMLNAAVTQGRLMTAQCNRAGRIPCEDEIYSHFVPAQ